jgi:hypothetical protein
MTIKTTKEEANHDFFIDNLFFCYLFTLNDLLFYKSTAKGQNFYT